MSQPDVRFTHNQTLALIECECERAYQHGLHKVWLKPNDDYDGMQIVDYGGPRLGLKEE